MKTHLMMIGSVLIASLFALPVQAQPGMGGMGLGAGAGAGASEKGPRDCSQAADPTACTAHREARTKALSACQGKAAGNEHRQCMQTQRQNIDCSQARNPQRCEMRKQAYRQCQEQPQGQPRQTFRQCVREKMSPASTSKATTTTGQP